MVSRINFADIKARKLSDKKIQLQYKLDIVTSDNVIGTIPMKFRYKVDNGIATLIPIKDVMYNRLSMSYAIKKKYIGICLTREDLDIFIDGVQYKIDRIPYMVQFSPPDMSWYRDWRLKNLFAN